MAQDPQNRPGELTVAAVLHGLIMQGNSQALIRIARTEEDRELRMEAVRALASMDSDEAVEFLMELLDDE